MDIVNDADTDGVKDLLNKAYIGRDLASNRAVGSLKIKCKRLKHLENKLLSKAHHVTKNKVALNFYGMS